MELVGSTGTRAPFSIPVIGTFGRLLCQSLYLPKLRIYHKFSAAGYYTKVLRVYD